MRALCFINQGNCSLTRVFRHDDSVGVEPWLAFSRDGEMRRLAMAKVDPDGDFSSDFEDLAFVRTGDCDD